MFQLHLFLIKCGGILVSGISYAEERILPLNSAGKNEANLEFLKGEKCELLFYKTELR